MEQTLGLYEWNIALGQVIMRDVAHFEVVLRNAYDHVMGERWGDAHDKDDPDQVIANLMLGFWAHLTDRSRERDLWIPYLNAAWPKGTDRNGLNNTPASIDRVRNRVAHNERLFNLLTEALSPVRADANIIRALRVLCPEAAERLYGDYDKTPVEQFCRENPAPVNVRL